MWAEHGRGFRVVVGGIAAEGIAKCIRAGAQIVGGCCGTGPEHIRAVAKMIRTM